MAEFVRRWLYSDEDAPRQVLIALVVIAVQLAVFKLVRLVRVPTEERPVVVPWQAPQAAELGWQSKPISNASIHAHLSDPTLLPPTAPKGDYITCYAPASGHHLATIHSATPQEIKDCISRAQIAQLGWKKTAWTTRRRVLRSLLKWCVDDMEGIARTASRDTGKTMVDAAFGEILVTAEKLRWVIASGEEALKPERRSVNLLMAHKVSEVRYEPLGVVAAVVSWNYPFHNVLSPIIASIFSGNSIVVKPSENVAWSSHHFIKAVRAIIAACGQDPDIVQIVTCLPNAVEALTGDPRIQHITFIGSEEIGQKVAIKGAEAGTPVLLELGGKDPSIILPSADLEYFGATWMRAAFGAAGQNCIGAERFIVASEVYDDFVASMTDRVRLLKVGDVLADGSGKNQTDLERTDVGALVSDRLFPRLEELITSAVKKGARLVAGGHRHVHPDLPHGHYFEPTLLVDVTPDMDIAQQEVFAPIMCVMKYDTIDDAIAIANGTRYGLGASVFGRNQTDCRYVVDRIESGMVCTNDFGVFYLCQSLPFGGAKASGYGRFAGVEGLRGLCNLKAVTEDRFHGYVQTSIPPPLRYPIRNGAAAWKFVSGLVRFAYADGVRSRVRGLWDLVFAGSS